MTAASPNYLIVMADEYMPGALGAAGHAQVRTPHLDALARGGVRFENAYTPSPMCVPGRAAFQTGRYVHDIGTWSSAEPYAGSPLGWGQHIRRCGAPVASVGKLHYRSTADDNGFDPELLPLHVTNGEGWIPGLLRKDPPPFDASGFAGDVGRGGSEYTQYDERICARACDWLVHAPNRPWVLFVSFVSPHYPLNAPAEFFDLYDPETVDMPFCYDRDERPDHPVVKGVMRASGYDRHFNEQRIRLARAAYYGLCSFVDDLFGRLIDALRLCGQFDHTHIVFTSDHGEMLGNHGAWTKMLMYEDSVGIPMILAGPDIPRGRTAATPVSLLDIAPMLCDSHGPEYADLELRGRSLADLAVAECPGRQVLSEYHDGWSRTGYFMLRWDQWKFIHYEGYAPQLFDLALDPEERNDLAADPARESVLGEGRRRLSAILDPGAVNDRAFRDQERLIAQYGGAAGIKKKMDLYFDYTPLSAETGE